jgi:hypothetical protein
VLQTFFVGYILFQNICYQFYGRFHKDPDSYREWSCFAELHFVSVFFADEKISKKELNPFTH